MSLRYFKEDYPELHVIAAGSLGIQFRGTLHLEGRIRSCICTYSLMNFLFGARVDLTIGL